MKNILKRTWVQVLFVILVAYCALIFISEVGSFGFAEILFHPLDFAKILIRPIAYFGTSEVKLFYFGSVLAGIVFLETKYIVKAIKNKNVDGLLAVLSCLIPLLGIVLCVWNRCKKEKNTEASTAYFIFSTAFIVVVLAVLIISAVIGGIWDFPFMF